MFQHFHIFMNTYQSNVFEKSLTFTKAAFKIQLKSNIVVYEQYHMSKHEIIYKYHTKQYFFTL